MEFTSFVKEDYEEPKPDIQNQDITNEEVVKEESQFHTEHGVLGDMRDVDAPHKDKIEEIYVKEEPQFQTEHTVFGDLMDVEVPQEYQKVDVIVKEEPEYHTEDGVLKDLAPHEDQSKDERLDGIYVKEEPPFILDKDDARDVVETEMPSAEQLGRMQCGLELLKDQSELDSQDRRTQRLLLRGKIIGMKEAGAKPPDIAQQLGISMKTVYKWLKREKKIKSLDDRPRPGQPRKTTIAIDQRIVELAQRNPFANASEIREELHLNVSEWTVRKRLQTAGIKYRGPVIKEKLTQAHKDERLEFAFAHIDKGMDFWSKVIFTDEKTFTWDDHGRLLCWKRPNSKYEPQNMYANGHIPANVWGWINLNCVGELAPIYGRFNADQYIELLEEIMIPSIRSLMPEPEKIIFMNSSRVHRSWKVQEVFQEQENVEVLDWPTKGCDLNPIEHVWANIVNNWEFSDERWSKDLLCHTRRCWEALRRQPNFVESVIQTLPERLHCVIAADGGWTRY